MDGSISIGVSLDASAFQTALAALRVSASQSAASAILPIVTRVNSLKTAFLTTASAGTAWGARILSVFTQVRTGANTLAGSLTTVGKTSAQRFLTAFASGNFAGAGRSAGTKLASGLSTMGGQFGTAGAALGACLRSGFLGGGYTAAGATAANSIASGILTGRGTVSGSAQIVASAVRSAFSGSWYGLGYNISAGVASGVRGGSGLISTAAISAARTALAAAKRALGVNSPSRVFRDEVGRMIPAGLAEGINLGGADLQSTVQRQSRLIVETARRDVTPALRLDSGAASAAESTPEVRVSVETPLYLDGRELARATAKYTGQQLLWEAV